jgi:hypothetical protein
MNNDLQNATTINTERNRHLELATDPGICALLNPALMITKKAKKRKSSGYHV